MNLERYNQVVFAILGTSALLGTVLLLGFLGLSVFRPNVQRGVVVDAPNVEKPAQNLMFCPPVSEPTATYEYIPVGVVVANNADEDAVIARSPPLASYKEGFGRCELHRYGGASRVFNVVIRNLKTNGQTLLISEPAQITSVKIPDAKCASGEGPTPCDALLWEIRSKDTNKDGRINNEDALVAYSTTLAGGTLAALTPADATLVEAKWASRAKKWHFQIRRDANKDGRFTDEDGSEVLEASASQLGPAKQFIEADIMRKLQEAAE